jgi:hypothetical protein
MALRQLDQTLKQPATYTTMSEILGEENTNFGAMAGWSLIEMQTG